MKRLFAVALLVGCVTAAGADFPPDAYFKMGDQISAATKARDWDLAITLSKLQIERYKSVDYRSADSHTSDIAGYHLNQLDLEAAESDYRSLLQPAAGRPVSDYDATGAYGLCRVYAERGDFSEALRWVKRYESSWSSGCGNCMEAQRQTAHMLRAVFTAAGQAVPQAEKALRDLIAGGYAPLKASINQGSEPAYKKLAKVEARLALAELFLRQGLTEKARPILADMSSATGERADLAAAHLKKLPSRTP